MEHRWGERVALDVPVKLTARPFALRNGRLIDVSVSGGFIRTGLDLRALTRIQIVLEGFRAGLPTPVVPAYVTRSAPDGVGIEWCEFAPRAILDLIRTRLRAPRTALTSERTEVRDHPALLGAHSALPLSAVPQPHSALPQQHSAGAQQHSPLPHLPLHHGT